MSMPSKYPSKCKKCGKEFAKGTTIHKIDEEYWCSDPDCGKSKETPKDAKTDDLYNYVRSISISRCGNWLKMKSKLQ